MKIPTFVNPFKDWRAYCAEFLGTFVFVFVASLSVLANNFYGEVGTLGIALATGLVIAAMVFATVHISGGHLNPAVTLALWLTQRISTVSAIFYILAQLLASFAAAFSLYLIFFDRAMKFSLGGPVLESGITLQTAVTLEAILTAILVFVVFATMVDKRGPVSFGPIVVGLVVIAASIAAGPMTGAALNPARALGPLVVSRHFDSLPVWIIGPFAGSLFGIVYDFVFLKKSKK